jgi:hypothetical protein
MLGVRQSSDLYTADAITKGGGRGDGGTGGRGDIA